MRPLTTRPTAPTVRYPSEEGDPLAADLRREVDAYFTSRGVSPKGDARAALRVALVFALVFASYALVLGPWLPTGWRLAPAFTLGLGLALIGMTVGHDALHGALSRRRWVNRALGLSFDFIGANSYIWRRTHNLVHHTYPNVEGVDVDLDYGAAMRLGPATPRRWWHRYQWAYGPLAYALAAIKWHFQTDYHFFLRRDVGPRHGGHPRSAWAGLVACKLWAYTYSIAIPLLVARPTWWQFLIGYLVVLLTAGFALGMTFQLAHAVEGVEFFQPGPSGRLPQGFTATQLRATANFACDNAVVTWLSGGLNYQVEHHLFPHVCSVHYPALRPIVRAVCARHGAPYREAPSVWAAFRAHIRHLHRLGAGEAPLEPAAVRVAARSDHRVG